MQKVRMACRSDLLYRREILWLSFVAATPSGP